MQFHIVTVQSSANSYAAMPQYWYGLHCSLHKHFACWRSPGSPRMSHNTCNGATVACVSSISRGKSMLADLVHMAIANPTFLDPICLPPPHPCLPPTPCTLFPFLDLLQPDLLPPSTLLSMELDTCKQADMTLHNTTLHNSLPDGYVFQCTL